MSRKLQNLIFISLILLALNFNMIFCAEIIKTKVIRTEALVEVTSDAQFFKDVEETLDALNSGVFISFNYVDSVQEKEDQDNEEIKNEDEIFMENEEPENPPNYDFDSDLDIDGLNFEQLEILQKEIENFDSSQRSEDELILILNKVKGMVNSFGKDYSSPSNNQKIPFDDLPVEQEAPLPSSSDNEDVYYSEDDHDAVLRMNTLAAISELVPEETSDTIRRNIRKLTIFKMFQMETEVKIKLNNII